MKKTFYLLVLTIFMGLYCNVDAKLVDDTTKLNPILNEENNPSVFENDPWSHKFHIKCGAACDSNGNSTEFLYLFDADGSNSCDKKAFYINDGRVHSYFLVKELVSISGDTDNPISAIKEAFESISMEDYANLEVTNATLTYHTTTGTCEFKSHPNLWESWGRRFVPLSGAVINKIFIEDIHMRAAKQLTEWTPVYSLYDSDDESAKLEMFTTTDENELASYNMDEFEPFVGKTTTYYLDGVASVPKYQAKCDDPNEELTGEGNNQTCVCKTNYYSIDRHCVKKQTVSTIDDAIAAGAQTSDGTQVGEGNMTIQGDGRIITTTGGQVYDKNGNALYIEDSNIQREQTKLSHIGNTGINNYVGYIIGFLTLIIGLIAIYASLKKYKKVKQM